MGAPHNELVSDLVLQNYQWKHFAIEQFRQGELPLWQNRQLAGSPFLATGQHSMLYPLSLLFLLLPLPMAFGWFAALSLTLAGLTLYGLLRVLGVGQGGALLGGLAFQGSGFLTTSLVFPMIVAGAAWLPLLLAALHRLAWPGKAGRLPWMGVGAIAIGLTGLAGHPEVLYYTLLVGGLYALWLLLGVRRAGRSRFLATGVLALVIGLLLSAAQWVPLYEVVSANFREGSAALDEVLGYAWPPRQASSFLVPDLLGNPARHEVYSLQTRRTLPILAQQPINAQGDTAPLDHVAWFKGTPDWKNYVEGAGYLGLLPLLLAVLAMGRGRLPAPRAAPFFLLLAAISLLFIFGSPLYGLLFHTLPGFKQLHTPFRWVWPLTLAVSVLAGLGWERVRRGEARRLSAGLGWAALLAGGAGLLLLGAMWLAPAPWLGVAARLLDRSQLARWAFGGSPDLFLSFQWRNGLHLAAAGAGAGAALLAARRAGPRRPAALVALLALGLLLLDLLGAARGFLPAVPSDVAAFVPPSIQWLRERHEPGAWRYTVLEQDSKVLNANATMQYGLEDVRGYDSIILKPYVQFMQALAPQGQLAFNRIAPLSTYDSPPDAELSEPAQRALPRHRPAAPLAGLVAGLSG